MSFVSLIDELSCRFRRCAHKTWWRHRSFPSVHPVVSVKITIWNMRWWWWSRSLPVPMATRRWCYCYRRRGWSWLWFTCPDFGAFWAVNAFLLSLYWPCHCKGNWRWGFGSGSVASGNGLVFCFSEWIFCFEVFVKSQLFPSLGIARPLVAGCWVERFDSFQTLLSWRRRWRKFDLVRVDTVILALFNPYQRNH